MPAKWYEIESSRARYKELIALRADGLTQQAIGDRLGGIRQATVQEMLGNVAALGFKGALDLLSVDPAARQAQLKLLFDLSADALITSGLPSKALVKEFQGLIRQLADEVEKLPGKTKATAPASPVSGYVDDLTRPRQRKETSASKELREHRHPAAQYLADLIEDR